MTSNKSKYKEKEVMLVYINKDNVINPVYLTDKQHENLQLLVSSYLGQISVVDDVQIFMSDIV